MTLEDICHSAQEEAGRTSSPAPFPSPLEGPAIFNGGRNSQWSPPSPLTWNHSLLIGD